MLPCNNDVIMNDTLTALKDYCAKLGADPEVFPDEEAKKRLPLFLSQIYEPVRANVFGRPMRLLVTKRRQHPTPTELETHAKLLSKYFGPNVALVLDGLASFERNRLLKKRVPFIVPHRQMFLPGVMIDLREVHGAPRQPEGIHALSMPAQLLVLHHLQKRVGDTPFALYQWAKALKYSRMSITRAHRELVEAGLVDATSPGKAVVIRFLGDRKTLWERALPLLRSPAHKQGYYRLRDVWPPSLLNAGLTALAHYTDLADAPQRTLATWRLFLKTHPEIEPVHFRERETVVIERWWYPPVILSEDNRTVDRLSLYLSLRGNADERVQAALTQLLEGVKW